MELVLFSLNACKKPNIEERLHIESITKLFYESGETGKSKHVRK